MLEQEFAAGHQGPEQILDDGPAFGGGCSAEHGFEALGFLGAGRARKAEQVGLLNEGGIVAFHQRGDGALGVAQIVVERFAVGEVQHLHHAGFVGALAFTGDLALVAAKGFQKVRGDRRVEELQRTGAVLVKIGFGRAAADPLPHCFPLFTNKKRFVPSCRRPGAPLLLVAPLLPVAPKSKFKNTNSNYL